MVYSSLLMMLFCVLQLEKGNCEIEFVKNEKIENKHFFKNKNLPNSMNRNTNLIQQDETTNNPFYFYERLFIVRNIKCSYENCPPPNFCIDEKTCGCGQGQVNFFPKKNSNNIVFCTYHQKRKFVAAILELLVFSGVGHFYAGRIRNGLTKLVVGLLPVMALLFLFCFTLVKRQNEGPGLERLVLTISCCSCCLLVFWQFFDAISFITGYFIDGNGIPLY